MYPDASVYSDSGNREHARRYRLVQAMFQPGGATNDSPLALVAWTSGGGGAISVDGRSAGVTEESMVVVPLHPAIAATAFTATDLQMDLVDVAQTHTSSGNFYDYSEVTLSPGGMATYETSLPAGRHWKDLKLSVTNQGKGQFNCGSFVKGMPVPAPVFVPGPPTSSGSGGSSGSSGSVTVTLPSTRSGPAIGGCTGSLSAQVFDFATGAWVKLPLISGGTQNVLDLGAAAGMVSPGGLLEIRLVAPGGGYIQPIVYVGLAADPA
jgi:hypothetical protein